MYTVAFKNAFQTFLFILLSFGACALRRTERKIRDPPNLIIESNQVRNSSSLYRVPDILLRLYKAMAHNDNDDADNGKGSHPKLPGIVRGFSGRGRCY